jgi:hypothetical protein
VFLALRRAGRIPLLLYGNTETFMPLVDYAFRRTGFRVVQLQELNVSTDIYGEWGIKG